MTDAPTFVGVEVFDCHTLSLSSISQALRLHAGDGLMCVLETDCIALENDAARVGFVPPDVAAEIKPWIKQGIYYLVTVTDNHLCPIHFCHPVVRMDPMKPKAREKTVTREREKETT